MPTITVTSLTGGKKPQMSVNWCGQPYDPEKETYYGESLIKPKEKPSPQALNAMKERMRYARECMIAKRKAKRVTPSKGVESPSVEDKA